MLDHPDVSRRHAYLQLVDGRPFVVDLESRTGVRIDGQSARSGWVDRTVEIGPYRIEVGPEGLEEPDPGPASPSGPFDVRHPGQGGGPEIVLESKGSRSWRMKTGMVLIGTAPDCRVRIQSDSVSRHHAALLRGPSGAWVVDLLGRGGLFVNGDLARAARLGHGDDLRVGRVRLKVCLGTDLPALSTPFSNRAPLPLPAFSPSVLPALPVVQDQDPRFEALVRQFGQMQQQMFDQFQQALMMMFQVFRTMHQDQVELVKAELERVQSLGRELEALQARAEAAASQPARSPAPSVPRPPLASAHPPSTADPDVHLMLHRRIAAIQEERQGRWQKVLNLMTGGVSVS